MKLTLEWITARCAVVKVDAGGLYRLPDSCTLWLNHKFFGETDQVITSLFGLMPETAYTLRVEDGKGATAALSFCTPGEFVTLDVRAFGAKGDGETNDTAAIQAALLACPAESRVLISKGTYRVSHLFLKSGIRLEIAKGGVLAGIPSREGLPVLPGMVESTDECSEYNLGTWEGNPLSAFVSLLTGIQVNHVEIYGEGIVDGMASHENWWKDAKCLQTAWRPRMLFLNRCENVVVAGLTLQNSPSWNIHPYFSKGVRLLGLTVIAPAHSPNTDGIDPESCENVEISGVRFSLGDDCIALKSGKRYMGDTYAAPCKDVRISHCEMRDGHGAVTLGSEMSGGIENVLVEDCEFYDTDRGLRIKTRRGRGQNAVIDGVRFGRIRMKNVKTPFAVNCFYCCDPDGRAPEVQDRGRRTLAKDTPEIKGLSFEGIVCQDCHAASAYFLGLPERPIGSIRMRNVEITFAENPVPEVPIMAEGVEACTKMGLVAENVDFLLLENVNVHGAVGEDILLTSVRHYERLGG